MRIEKLSRFILALFVLAAPPAGAEEKCEIRRYAELPVTMSGTRPIVHGTINGQPANFLADSGAFYSLLSRETAEKYHLNVVGTPNRLVVNGITDSEVASMTTIKEFALTGFLAGSTVKNVQFLVTGGAAMAGVDGIVGQNVLGGADTEYDLANGVIRLFQSKHCNKKILAYWASNANMEVGMVQLEGRTPLQPHLIGTGMVNEKKIKVVFDSGAWRSTLTRDFAQRVGIKPEDESVKAAGNASGLGKRRVESWIARFDSMDIGGERVRNPRLRISEIRMAGDGDMLLGADFFLSHRIYVAAQQNKIYFTYNGGPVFDLRESPVIANNKSDVARQADSIDGETSGNNKSDNTLTPAELRRRGAAFAGRGQLKEALADLDLAVKIDKDDPQNYYQRGEIHWRNNEPDLALEDINTVLRIQPDNVAALVLRGELLLFKKDKTGATQDFIAASSLSHDDASTELSIAESYGRAHEYNDLIKHLDNWAAKNKKDERMQQVLNMRCHARLMLRTQLDMALADCSKAIDLGSPYAGIYNNRGLVYLQQSNLDKAMKDFQKALKLQPKDALALYALGIVERGKGNKAQAEKDIGSALTIAPHIDQLFKQTGIGVQ